MCVFSRRNLELKFLSTLHVITNSKNALNSVSRISWAHVRPRVKEILRIPKGKMSPTTWRQSAPRKETSSNDIKLIQTRAEEGSLLLLNSQERKTTLYLVFKLLQCRMYKKKLIGFFWYHGICVDASFVANTCNQSCTSKWPVLYYRNKFSANFKEFSNFSFNYTRRYCHVTVIGVLILCFRAS